jgi:hypothetical protein
MQLHLEGEALVIAYQVLAEHLYGELLPRTGAK